MRSLFTCLLFSGLLGCAADKSTVCFTTRTVVGINVNGAPPALDFGYARQELSIAPVTDAGQVLPVLASFTNRSKFILSKVLGLGIGQSFAVGNAALSLALFTGAAGTKRSMEGEDDSLFVEKRAGGGAPRTGPSMRMHEEPAAVPGQLADARLYVFGTNTALGLEVTFDAAAGFPTSGSIGWRREEFARVPIFEHKDAEGVATHILIPSLVATTSALADAQAQGTEVGITQYYATGLAAVFVTGIDSVRSVLSQELAFGAVQQQIDQEHADHISLEEAIERAKQRVDALDPNQLDDARAALLEAVPDANDPGSPLAEWPTETTPAAIATKRELLKRELGAVEALDQVEAFLAANLDSNS
ncbi:MAG: hypothetical protein R3F49_06005 [Planctomycetota bacterium]